MKKRLFPVLVLLFGLAVAAAGQADTFYVTFENTGDEDIYYSIAVQRPGWLTWGSWKAEGWRKLRAGERQQAFYGVDRRAVFAFSKRGGYVVYSIDGATGGRWINGWHVSPSDSFSYTFDNKSTRTASRPDYIKSSFGYHYETRSFGGNHMASATVEIPSFKSDKVTPFESTRKRTRQLDRERQALKKLERLKPPAAFKELDARLAEHLSNVVCYDGKEPDDIRKYPRNAAGVNESGELLVRGLHWPRLHTTYRYQSIPLRDIGRVGTRTHRSRPEDERCYEVYLHCAEARDRCASRQRLGGDRQQTRRLSLYFDSPVAANQVLAELDQLLDDSVSINTFWYAPANVVDEDAEPTETAETARPETGNGAPGKPFWVLLLLALLALAGLGYHYRKSAGGVPAPSISRERVYSVASHIRFFLFTLTVLVGYFLSALFTGVAVNLLRKGEDLTGYGPLTVLAVTVLSLTLTGAALGYLQFKTQQAARRMILNGCIVIYAVCAALFYYRMDKPDSAEHLIYLLILCLTFIPIVFAMLRQLLRLFPYSGP